MSAHKGTKKLSSSTIVDLKNELYRKKAEFDFQKAASTSAKATKKKLGDVLKQGSNTDERKAVKPVRELTPEPVESESDQLTKSRAALERKAALYEKLSRGEEVEELSNIHGEDDDEGYLVDFDRKIVHEKPSISNDLPDTDYKYKEDDWVEYVDQMGYKRRCIKEDLSNLKYQSKRIRTEDQLAAISKRSDLLSRDDMRELERQRWEAKARGDTRHSSDEESDNEGTGHFEPQKPVAPLHYSHISTQETRMLGVGYFSFSNDETERQQQMSTLDKLHDQTAEQRRKAASIKAKREELKKARLAKVVERRQQQGIEIKLPANDEEEGAEKIEEEFEITTVKDETGLTWPSRYQSREWDRGKDKPSSSSAWRRAVEERRNERPSEFAPPDIYRRKKL